MGAGAADTVALSLRVQCWAVVASTEYPVFVMSSLFGCGDIWCSVAMTPEDTGTGTGAAAESSGGEKGGGGKKGKGKNKGRKSKGGKNNGNKGTNGGAKQGGADEGDASQGGSKEGGTWWRLDIVVPRYGVYLSYKCVVWANDGSGNRWSINSNTLE
jgi:hypothetical protein